MKIILNLKKSKVKRNNGDDFPVEYCGVCKEDLGTCDDCGGYFIKNAPVYHSKAGQHYCQMCVDTYKYIARKS